MQKFILFFHLFVLFKLVRLMKHILEIHKTWVLEQYYPTYTPPPTTITTRVGLIYPFLIFMNPPYRIRTIPTNLNPPRFTSSLQRLNRNYCKKKNTGRPITVWNKNTSMISSSQMINKRSNCGMCSTMGIDACSFKVISNSGGFSNNSTVIYKVMNISRKSCHLTFSLQITRL